MKKENIKKIGIEKGVKNLDLFIEFLSRRFPNESDRITSYFCEWADRFNSGTPENFMDEKSKKVYEELETSRAEAEGDRALNERLDAVNEVPK